VLAGGKGSPPCSDGIDILIHGIKPTALPEASDRAFAERSYDATVLSE
jgi:hypothetical protein